MSFLRRIRKLLCPDVESFAKDAEQGHPDSIKQRGWLQWSCVGSADLPSTLRSTALDLELASLSTDVRLLIVSQSCDLVHHSYESEPFAEAYLCEALALEEPENGNLTAGKNPRELLVPFTLGGVKRMHRLHSKGRVLLPRYRLAMLDPDPSLVVPPSSVRVLQRWLINRIVRTAFPDAFNDRTGKAVKKLEDRLKKHGAPLLGLYINVAPWDELPQDQPYDVDFVGLIDEDLPHEQRKAVEKVLGDICAAYSKTEGIGICDYQVLDESEASMSMQRTHRLFTLDYLSFRPKPGGDLPPPG